jgi:signal transduction histidine kinase
MLDRLEHAFEAQRQFVDDAGHELRTPITVIRGHLELLDDDPADRERALALVMDELERMNRIVDDLLLLAKAERPDSLVLEDVVVPELTVDVVAKARALAPRRWVVDEMADVVVLADGQRLTQALMQLAANAVQHTEKGDRIGVGSRVAAGQLVLHVSDSGPGVAADDVDRIFERFQRGSGARRGGAGLGLAIVRSIAIAHGGSVRVEKGPGGGAVFTLELPLRDAAPTDHRVRTHRSPDHPDRAQEEAYR